MSSTITKADTNVEVGGGVVRVSAMVPGWMGSFRLVERFIGYSKREAERAFRQRVNNQIKINGFVEV